MPLNGLKDAFSSHPRRWRDFRYVYPVISRRSGGLSIGINLNPDATCNFDCIYCCADRSHPRTGRRVDLDVLQAELWHLIETRDKLFDEPEFRGIPAPFRKLHDIAFSGDGEATAVPAFPPAVDLAIRARRDHDLTDVKTIIITDACYLTRPAVARALERLDQNNGEIWAKLDAGTEDYFQHVNRPNCTLQHVLDNILAAGKIRPLVVQSLFIRIQGEPPSNDEIAAYCDRLRWLRENGAAISGVQVYTVARRTVEPYVAPLSADELETIAAAVRDAGFPSAIFP